MACGLRRALFTYGLGLFRTTTEDAETRILEKNPPNSAVNVIFQRSERLERLERLEHAGMGSDASR
jgi:hypothetical protein